MGPPRTLPTLESEVSAAIAGGLVWPLTGVYWIDIVLSLFWFVVITNAFNLIDNIDGLAAGVAAIAAAVKVTVFLAHGQMEDAALAAAAAVPGSSKGDRIAPPLSMLLFAPLIHVGLILAANTWLV